ncbi:MAG TPA: arginine deiminase family protein [Methanoregula sp.]|nr:arginine deiminase family protein [Methanoregula sp.]
MDAHVRAEWDRLRTVALHRPGMEMFFGLLEPYASLYDRAFSQDGALSEIRQLEEILHRDFGVGVVHLRETITARADGDPAFRDRLVEAGRDSIAFSGDPEEARLAQREFEKTTALHDAGFFFDLMLLHPVVGLSAGPGIREIDSSVTGRQPLSNLYFLRDQQAVTANGVVLGSMAKPQRRREPAVTRLFWEATGTPVTGEVEGSGTFEGGDFFPLGDFALVGTGDRTDRAGAARFLASGPGYDEIGIVRQPAHPLAGGGGYDPMVAMHLDTWFNVASSGVAVGLEPLMREARVEVMAKDGDGYRKEGEETDLFSYIRSKGFDVIGITTLEQMAFAPNFLCIRDGTILAVEVDRTAREVLKTLGEKAAMMPSRYGALLAQARKDYEKLRREGQFFPHKKEIYSHDIDAVPVSLVNLTGGYGAAHCLTCPIRRG